MRHLGPSPKPKARPRPRHRSRSKSLRGLQIRIIGVARNLSPSASRSLRMLRPRICSLFSGKTWMTSQAHHCHLRDQHFFSSLKIQQRTSWIDTWKVILCKGDSESRVWLSPHLEILRSGCRGDASRKKLEPRRLEWSAYVYLQCFYFCQIQQIIPFIYCFSVGASFTSPVPLRSCQVSELAVASEASAARLAMGCWAQTGKLKQMSQNHKPYIYI